MLTYPSQKILLPYINTVSNLLCVVLCFTLPALVFSCKNVHERTPERAFYYWKSRIQISAGEILKLDSLKAKKLYVKFFDIVKSRENHEPMPAAKIQSNNSLPQFYNTTNAEIVPVVFITNECFLQSDSTKVNKLAKNTASLLLAMSPSIIPPEATFKEIQFDCDWTATTRDAYFGFLAAMRQFLPVKQFSISATIRLYQCKYLKKTGVPPVDRGLLMCYNMGNLRDPSITANSILNLKDLRQYTDALEAYPMELDVALPIFDWKVLIRNNVYAGLIQQLPDSILNDTLVANRSNNTYIMLKDTLLYGYSLKANDVLRNEQSKYEDIIAAGEIISKKLNSRKLTVSLYHLDSITLGKYFLNELENIYISVH